MLIGRFNGQFHITNEVSDGKKALLIIPDGNIDAVITDIKMPVIDGIELLKELRENLNIDIPVILVSTYNEFEYARQGLVYNAFDYIVKPLEQAKINASLTNLQNILIKQLAKIEKQNIMQPLIKE